MEGNIKFPAGDVLTQQPGNKNILGPDEKRSVVFNGMRKNVIRAEPPVGDKDGLCFFIVFKAVHQAAECAEFIFPADRLQLNIKIAFAQDVIQRDNMKHVKSPFRLSAWRIKGISILFIEWDIKFGAVTGNKPISILISYRLEMAIELFEQRKKSMGFEFIALLDKSRNSSGVGTETEIFK